MRAGVSVRCLLVAFLALALALPLFTSASTPHLVYLQGKLTFKANSTSAPSVVVNVTVWLSPSGGSQVAGFEGGQNTTTSTNGTFNLVLGSTLPLNLNFNQQYYLEVRAGGEVVNLGPSGASTNRSAFIASGGPANASELNYSGNASVEDTLRVLSPDADLLFLAHFNNNTLSTKGEQANTSGSLTYNTAKYGLGVTVDNSSSLNGSISFATVGNINGTRGTIAFWVKPLWPGSDPGQHQFFDINSVGQGASYLKVNTFGGQLRFQVTNGTPGFLRFIDTNISSWAAGSTHHVVGRYDFTAPVTGSQFFDLWVDGVQYTSGVNVSLSQSVPALANAFFIGRTSPVSESDIGFMTFANATLDEFAIWGRVLSPAEISSLYRSTSQLASGEPFDLVKALGLQAGTCPSGFVDQGEYCIMRDLANGGASLSYQPGGGNAGSFCTNRNTHLCKPSEWLSACGAGVLTNTAGPEMVDDVFQDGAGIVKYTQMGINVGTCVFIATNSVNNPSTFRCCKTKPSTVGGFGGPINVLTATDLSAPLSFSSSSFAPLSESTLVINFTTSTTSNVLLSFYSTVTVSAGQDARLKFQVDGAQLESQTGTLSISGSGQFASSAALVNWITVGPGAHTVKILGKSASGTTVGFSDNRLTAAIFPQTSLGGAIGGARSAQAVGLTPASNPAFSCAAGFQDLTDMNVTIESLGGPVFITGYTACFTDTVGGSCGLRITVDGVPTSPPSGPSIANVLMNAAGLAEIAHVSINHVQALTPGLHTVKLQFACGGATTGSAHLDRRALSVLAVKPA